MTFQEKMEKVRVYMYAGNFFMFGGVLIVYGIIPIFTQNKQDSGFIFAHLIMISLGVFLTSIGVLIIRVMRQ